MTAGQMLLEGLFYNLKNSLNNLKYIVIDLISGLKVEG